MSIDTGTPGVERDLARDLVDMELAGYRFHVGRTAAMDALQVVRYLAAMGLKDGGRVQGITASNRRTTTTLWVYLQDGMLVRAD